MAPQTLQRKELIVEWIFRWSWCIVDFANVLLQILHIFWVSVSIKCDKTWMWQSWNENNYQYNFRIAYKNKTICKQTGKLPCILPRIHFIQLTQIFLSSFCILSTFKNEIVSPWTLQRFGHIHNTLCVVYHEVFQGEKLPVRVLVLLSLSLPLVSFLFSFLISVFLHLFQVLQNKMISYLVLILFTDSLTHQTSVKFQLL